MDNPILQKKIIIFIVILWVINEFRASVLTPLLKQLMSMNAMNGAISDMGSGLYKWQRQCISSFS
ncbi:Uncharacterised protein [Klebsiella pneumoniae]|uniref:Uncharacterized protein n=1 Tax=Klebsiella pneumoniae TaxID=573 RepID=A0A486V4H5_KLEPN|nr:hypothetical protein SL33_00991 [Klebsiella pneumoniae]SAT30120.1 Uncharacterised protein [Klebsiella pneumoniae]SAT47834.1 Uncharacterised protein [Klebsiella pneumoniae]SAW33984.1 Uncharacterised protein [Klebsiella pneumoniae]SLR76568.1 Uncharacterised protein [Klebsiella pneumoniae]